MLGFGAVLLGWLIYSARRWPARLTSIQAAVLSVALLAVYPVNCWIYPKMGYLIPFPMHLCDWAAVTAAIALIFRIQIFAELTYFWALAGATNALITPDVAEGIPHPRFIVFFVHHIGIVVAGLWLTVGMQLTPRKNSIWRVFAWSQLFLIAAMITNHITGHNYGFLAHKPEAAAGTLLDYMGPWPWYILVLEMVCLCFFLILDSPWRIVRRAKRDSMKPPAEVEPQ